MFPSLRPILTALFATSAIAAVPFRGGDAFIQKNCASCHSSSSPAARLDLTKLSYEPGQFRDLGPFTMTVKSSRIAYVQFSGPREGEYPAADEVRFTPLDGDAH
jgi:hypothetical protein